MKLITEATTELNIKKNDPGLLTWKGYSELRNPESKTHPSNSYDKSSSIPILNYFEIPTKVIGSNYGYSLLSNYSDTVVSLVKDSHSYSHVKAKNNPIAFVHNSILYYDPVVVNDKDIEEFKQMEWSFNTTKKTKYVFDKMNEIIKQMAIEKNKKNKGTLIKRIKRKDEYFSFYVNKDEMTVSVFNKDFLIIASGQNEFGTTLIQVAKEYRGFGLGPIIGEVFIDIFGLPSGGYTPQGKHNAKKIWRNRVSEFIQNGWYSLLLNKGEISKKQVKAIIDDFKSFNYFKPSKIQNVTPEKESRDYLIYIDDDNVTFAVYDSKFIEDNDEKFIYAYGFIRDFHGKEILYSFDYDSIESKKILAYTVLQTMKDRGKKLFIGGKPSDYVDIEELPHIEVNNNYATLTKDVININDVKRLERAKRKPYDKMNEIEYSLLEMAETKFNKNYD